MMVRKALGWSIVPSILMIVAGVLAIILPPVAGIVASVFIGWLFIFSGVAHLVLSWHTRSTGGLLLELLIGVLYLMAGTYLLLNPVAGMVSLTLGLAIYRCAEAVLEFILAFRLRPLPGSGWLLVDGVVTLLLAITIWRTWPSSSSWGLAPLWASAWCLAV
jgi:uncharacterized membrane protein HdeD (DUF308 family)